MQEVRARDLYAALNATSQDGHTALILASYFGHLKVVEALLAGRAGKEAKDEVGSR